MLKYWIAIRTIGTYTGMSDDELLEKYASRRDNGAFEALVARHDRLVMSVCRSVLESRDDAEDAFQATFLILSRKFGHVRPGCLGPYLHGVAFRVATKLRADESRRRARERESLQMPRIAGAPHEGLLSWEALHEEVNRLPERYRRPVVLCYLEGMTYESAAMALGWPVGTVRSRLSRGRERLKSRLTLRKAAPSLALLGAALSAGNVSASEALVASTTAVVGAFVAGKGVAGSATPTSVALAMEVMRAMALTKLKLVAAGSIAASVVLLGGASLVPAIAACHAAVPVRPLAIGVEEKTQADEFAPYTNRQLEEIGYKHHVAENYPEALRFLGAWSRREPSNPKPHSMMGWSRLLIPNLEDAKASFDLATKLAPKDQDGWHGLWSVAFSKDNFQEALGYIDKAISLDSERVNLRLDRAMTKTSLDDFAGAIRDCDEVLKLIANDPDKARAERDSAIAREHREKAKRLLAEKEGRKPLGP